MSDEELEAMLASAGYTFEPETGMYATADDPGGEGKDPETVADDLSIALDELLAWQSRFATRVDDAPTVE